MILFFGRVAGLGRGNPMYGTYMRRLAKMARRERCPVCGSVGSGPYLKRVKGIGYLYFAHPYRGEHREWSTSKHGRCQ